jgi:hypothetical protein
MLGKMHGNTKSTNFELTTILFSFEHENKKSCQHRGLTAEQGRNAESLPLLLATASRNQANRRDRVFSRLGRTAKKEAAHFERPQSHKGGADAMGIRPQWLISSS